MTKRHTQVRGKKQKKKKLLGQDPPTTAPVCSVSEAKALLQGPVAPETG